MNNWKRAALCALMFLVLVSPVLAQPRTATITLGRDPEPPYCALNPGGTVDIFWNIQHSTTPRYVYYKLEDPTRTLILQQQTYPGATGLNISRSWTVPTGLGNGKYWVRVEYWSFEAGNEADAEVTFYICSTVGNLCVWKYKDANCNGVLDSGDPPVSNWWVCIRTPEGDDICAQTNGDGKVCWFGIPLGHYTVYEPLPMDPPWQPVGPTSYEIDLVGSSVVDVQFLNVKYDECFGACCLPNGQCIEVKPEECVAQNGVFHGLGSLCAGIVCPQPGSCCDPATGVCTFVLASSCPPGWLWIANTPCLPNNPCPQLGACCDPLGTCTLTLQANCLPPSIWHGEWTSCVPNNCPQPPGACCFADGHCVVLTEEACLTAPGHVRWLGPFTTCLPDNPCTQPGACCDPVTGACTYIFQEACPPGWLWIASTPCAPNNPCPQLGACCDPLGSCTVTMQVNCQPPSIWHPEWTSCVPNNCPPPLGACCFLDGHCELLSEAQCLAAPDHVSWLGPFTTCLPDNPCVQPGACCDLATGACTFVLQDLCVAPLVFVGGTCVPNNPCPQPGACCNPDTGACAFVLQAACPQGWTWLAGVACVPTNPCPPPVPTGACCDPQGNCTITTQAGCVPPSVWHPEYVSCTPNFCPPPVPVEGTTWGRIKANYR
jgi:hypothetical protein